MPDLGFGRSRLGVTWVVDTPCPSCGNETVIGFMYVNERGEHMHTHYICTFWPSGVRPEGPEFYVSTRPCSWHGWSVPEVDDG